MGPLGSTLTNIQKALIGDDMTHGLVKDVSTLTLKVESMLESTTEKRSASEAKKERWTREKIAILGLVSAIVGIFFGHLLDKVL